MNEFCIKERDLQTVIELANACSSERIGVYSANFGDTCKVFGLDANNYCLFETSVTREPIPSKPSYTEFFIQDYSVIHPKPGGAAPTIYDYGYTFQTFLPVPLLSIEEAILKRGTYWRKRIEPRKSKYQQTYSALVNFLNFKTLAVYTRGGDFKVSLWKGWENSVLRVNFNDLYFTLFI